MKFPDQKTVTKDTHSLNHNSLIKIKSNVARHEGARTDKSRCGFNSIYMHLIKLRKFMMI